MVHAQVLGAIRRGRGTGKELSAFRSSDRIPLIPAQAGIHSESADTPDMSGQLGPAFAGTSGEVAG